MKKLLLILLSVILVAVGAVACLQPSSQLQINDAYADTEIFICLDHQGYSLVKPELVWSGPATLHFQFFGVSPNGDIFFAPQEYTIFKIENGSTVQVGDYNPTTFGGAGGFSFSPDGTLYFCGNVGSVGTIFKVINGRIGYDTIYYQRESKSTEPFNFIRGFGFGSDGALYFTGGSGIYKVENGVESLLYDFKTRARELNLTDDIGSIAITREGTIYFTSGVSFRKGDVSWSGFGPQGVVLQLTEEGEEQVICAVINQWPGRISVGPDDSYYILTWKKQRTGSDLMQLWKFALKGAVNQRIVQTNANTLQSHSFVKKTRRAGVCFNVYTVTTGTISDFCEETNEEGATNGLSCVISNEPGNTTEVIVAIPKDAIKHASRIRAEVGGTQLRGDIIESKTMYFVVVSYSQTQDLQRLTLTW